MQDRTLPPSVLEIFRSHLQHAERSPSTIEKYLRSVRVFACWLNGRTVTKDAVAAWKAHLVAQSYAPVTVNAALSALNSLFQYLGWEDCRVRFLKIQRRLFREPDRELEPVGLSAPGPHSPAAGENPSRPADGNDLRYRHPGQRGILHHPGGGTVREGRNCPEGKNPHHFASLPAVPENCLHLPGKIKPPPVRSFSPEAGRVCPENKSGWK